MTLEIDESKEQWFRDDDTLVAYVLWMHTLVNRQVHPTLGALS